MWWRSRTGCRWSTAPRRGRSWIPEYDFPMSVGDVGDDAARRVVGLEDAVAAVVARSDGIADAGERVLGAIAEALDFQAGVLWRVGPAGQQLVPSVTWAGRDGLEPFISDSRGRVFSPEVGLPGQVWSTVKVLWYPDLTDPAQYLRAASAAAVGIRSAVGIPLVAHGQLLGVAELLSDETVNEDPELTAVFEGLGRQVGQLLERAYADAALAESDARKAAVLDASLDAILTGDATGRIIEANRAATELFGWLPDEIVGRRVG